MALKEYRRQVRKWLEKTFPKNLDCFIFSGGAVTLLLPEIEEYCNSYRRISTSTYYEREIEQDVYYFKTEIEAENPLYEAVTRYAIGEDSIELIDDRDLALRVAAQLNISKRDIKELSLDKRYVDPYGMFEYLLLAEQQQLQEKRDADKLAKVKQALQAKLKKAKQALEAAYNALQAKVTEIAKVEDSIVKETKNGNKEAFLAAENQLKLKRTERQQLEEALKIAKSAHEKAKAEVSQLTEGL